MLCTHFIQPSAPAIIQRLGIATALEAVGAVRNGLQFWTRWGWIHAWVGERPGRPTYGYNVRHQVLDPISYLSSLQREIILLTSPMCYQKGVSFLEFMIRGFSRSFSSDWTAAASVG